MNKTLHELHLKFIIQNKVYGDIVAAFSSATEAITHLKHLNKKENLYELKEIY